MEPAPDRDMLNEQRQLDALGSLLMTAGVLMVQVIPHWSGANSWENAIWRGLGLLSTALSLSALLVALPAVYRRHRGALALAFRACSAALPHVRYPQSPWP